MKKKWITLIGQCAFLSLSVGACDSFEEDFIPEENQIVINPAATAYYALSNTDVLLDLKTLIKSASTTFNMSVSEGPVRGTLTHLSGFLLKYTPSSSFTVGQDRLVVRMSSDHVVVSEEITIHMTPNTSSLPCGVYALADFVYTAPRMPVSIESLDNDRICGFSQENIQVSISVGPSNGQATINGTSIIYESHAGFEGTDEIGYTITAGNEAHPDGALVSHALIKVHVSTRPCPYFILDEYTLDLTNDNEDVQVNTGDCAGGFDIPIWGIITPPCSRYGYYIREISQSALSGIVCFGSDGGLAYHPDPDKTPQNETVKFELCVNGECKVVTVDIVREQPG